MQIPRLLVAALLATLIAAPALAQERPELPVAMPTKTPAKPPTPSAVPEKPTGTVVTPGWVKDAIFYQIFPERFANGDRKNDPKGTEPWGAIPKTDNYMGGDLDGVRQSLPYLQALGVTALYFNPIFTSDSNHKYHTVDYMHVDPAFGGDAAFDRLLGAAHARGMKVVLDGVFNHTGDTHPFFLDAAKKGSKSKYWNWYRFDGFPVVKQPKPNYAAWWGMSALPQLQVAKNPEVANYIFQVEEHWLKKGIDGWRLDVPNEIDSDAFWREFRKRAKAIKPDAYIVGEIWDPAGRWLQGDQFDAVMNYQWRDALVKFFAKRESSAADLDGALKKLRADYHPAITHAMFNVLGSHDTERFLTLAGGDTGRLRLAVACQMTQPGAPVIYYGDEVGMQGGKDPDDRRAFDWRSDRWNRDVLGTYQKLIAARKAHVALRTGQYRTLWTQDGIYAYGRDAAKDDAIVALNNSGVVRDVSLPVAGWLKDGVRMSDVLGGRPAVVRKGLVWLRLDPQQAAVFVPGSPPVAKPPAKPKPARRKRYPGAIL